jgi:site-specific DNA recombinase
MDDLVRVRDNKKVQAVNLKSFISNLKCIDDKLSEWNEPIWMLLHKGAVVHRDKSITFKLNNGKEIRSQIK